MEIPRHWNFRVNVSRRTNRRWWGNRGLVTHESSVDPELLTTNKVPGGSGGNHSPVDDAHLVFYRSATTTGSCWSEEAVLLFAPYPSSRPSDAVSILYFPEMAGGSANGHAYYPHFDSSVGLCSVRASHRGPQLVSGFCRVYLVFSLVGTFIYIYIYW